MEISMQPRMEQRLKMAPQIIQSIEILQLPLMALQERIEQEQLENPMLEIEELAEPERVPAEARELTRAEKEEVTDEFRRVKDVQPDFQDYFWQASPSRRPRGDEKDEKLEAIQNSPGRKPSLRDHLMEQVLFMDIDARMREVVEGIINNLDRDGRLCFSLEEIAYSLDDPPTQQEAEEALAIVQSLDPPGVGARDLIECLLLQLDRSDENYDLQALLIREYLRDIEANRFPHIARKTGHSIEEIKAAVGAIVMLNPVPGRLYDDEIVPIVVPDVHVEELDGQYDVRLDEAALPKVRINPDYRALLQNEKSNTDTGQFLRKKMESARWLIDSIQQRRRTILKVAREIVAAQRGFFEKGLEELRPLKMQEVADAIGMHVATVSRAIRHKYMHTPRGVYPMRFFFTSGTRSADGEVQTWDAVRERIRQAVEAEDKHNPLSDEDIVNKLAEEGIKIARRTVTKYRKALSIPTSRQRKLY